MAQGLRCSGFSISFQEEHYLLRGPGTTIHQGRPLAVLALLSAFAPFAIDMLPTRLRADSRDFRYRWRSYRLHTVAFFLRLAFGQALYGPLIDRFDRRVPLLIGIAIFIAVTIGCLLVRDIDLFIGLRMWQAVGGYAGMIIGRGQHQ